ncbi:MAG: hypothetical protein LBV00_01380 [Propionibacteriaceae bacterium]|jgi:hypothetical protein|nr:hypothetical protein [Propionibacteriaceae bacterium]
MGASVHDPAINDPATGQPIDITDPMSGIWRAAARNPDWLKSWIGTDSTTVERPVAGRNDPTDLFDTALSNIPTRLSDIFHRGFDQASDNALIAAFTAADTSTILNDEAPTLLGAAQTIAKAMMLEDHLNPRLPESIHIALDALSMVPVVDILADSLNALFYTAEGDTLNAALSAVGILAPSLLDAGGKSTKWANRIASVTRGIGIPHTDLWKTHHTPVRRNP